MAPDLYADAMTAIRRPEWLDAVRAFVEELYKRGRSEGR